MEKYLVRILKRFVNRCINRQLNKIPVLIIIILLLGMGVYKMGYLQDVKDVFKTIIRNEKTVSTIVKDSEMEL